MYLPSKKKEMGEEIGVCNFQPGLATGRGAAKGRASVGYYLQNLIMRFL